MTIFKLYMQKYLTNGMYYATVGDVA